MKENKRTYHGLFDMTVVMGIAGAGKYFTEKLLELTTQIDAILSADGQKVKATSYLVHLRCFSDDVFLIQPIVLQTAGTYANGVDLTTKIEDTNLDPCVDDVYGYSNIGKASVARRSPPFQDDEYRAFTVQRTVALPLNILALLAKEGETERLQNLYFGVYGGAAINSQTIFIRGWCEIEFTVIKKSISLR